MDYLPFRSLLKNIVDNRGKTCPTAEDGIPLIATNCIKNENLYPVFEKIRFITRDTYDNWFRGHPEPGDILFVTKGSPGRVCLVPDPFNFVIAQDMVSIRADEKIIDPHYLFAALRSNQIQKAIENLHVGTMIPHFKKGDFDKLLIPVPSKHIQKSIGDFYFHLSQKIELNRQMNHTLEAMARAIFKSWFVDFDPVYAKMEGRDYPLPAEVMNLFPDELVGSELGLIPRGWEVGKLGDISINRREGVHPGAVASETKYIGLEHMPRRSIALDSWETAEKISSNKFAYKKGDILFGKLRPYFHKVGIAPIDGICSTDILVIKEKEYYHNSYILLLVSSKAFVDTVSAAATGTKMPRTNWKYMESYQIAIPPRGLFEHFENITNVLIERVVLNIRSIKNLSEIRDSLLPKLMSGEIEV